MKNWNDAVIHNPLAVRVGSTVVNVTKIQEVDDPTNSNFRVVLVSGVTAFGTLEQYSEVMEKYLDYLDFTHRKLCNEVISETENTNNAITITTETKGTKHDSGKVRYSLLPKGVLEKVLSILEFGANKYSKDNWQQVPNARDRYYDAAMRHIQAWYYGETKDPETGESHLAHALCCLMFLLWLDIK